MDLLASVKKSDVQELKSFAKPPQLVKDVLVAACYAVGALCPTGRDDADWMAVKKCLAAPRCLENFLKFRPGAISPEVLARLAPLAATLDLGRAKKNSAAVEGLAAFVLAVVEYGKAQRL